MEEMKSKVYVFIDKQSRIIRCEGGYTMSNIDDISQWTQIDEGVGDKYNLCQSHYFEGGLFNDKGIPLYKLEEGNPVKRTTEEIETDESQIPAPSPSTDERMGALEEELLSLSNAIKGGLSL